MSRFPMRTFQQDAILKRLADGLVALEVSNVKTLTTEQCNKLQCGDVVVKKDSSGEHAYVVTFKSDTGMCLTYTDASVVETQSYDKVSSEWVYNSEDLMPLNKLENITDKDGHLRFIEGNITIQTITGVLQTYGKWSLSGTHLMCVIAGTIDADTTLPIWRNLFAYIELPKWIIDKIYPVSTYYLDQKDMVICALTSSGSVLKQPIAVYVNNEGNKLELFFDSGVGIEVVNASGYRLQFDLLIDNE